MQRGIVHAVEATSLVDVLERILDKGVVIAGDISIKIGDIELLSISIRLLIASVDRAKEMGIDWWEGNPFLSSLARRREEEHRIKEKEAEIEALKRQIEQMESNNTKKSFTRSATNLKSRESVKPKNRKGLGVRA